MDLVEAARTLRFWPVVLIALGAWILYERGTGGHGFSGYMLMAIGFLLLMNSLGLARVRFWDLFWPVIIVLIGTRLVMQTSSPRRLRFPFQTSAAGSADGAAASTATAGRSEEHTSELQSPCNLVC